MDSNDCRNKFKESGLKYSDIGSREIAKLSNLLRDELYLNNKFNLSVNPDIKCKYDKNGSIISCFIYVNSNYFTKREAFSFNSEEFIGFCGWADRSNCIPFYNTFDKWDDLIKK
jgi:hypothetical protein